MSSDLDLFPQFLWDYQTDPEGLEYTSRGTITLTMKNNIYFYSANLQDKLFFKSKLIFLDKIQINRLNITGVDQKQSRAVVDADEDFGFLKCASFPLDLSSNCIDIPPGICSVLLSNGILLLCTSDSLHSTDEYPVPLEDFTSSRYSYYLRCTGIKILKRVDFPTLKFSVKTFAWYPKSHRILFGSVSSSSMSSSSSSSSSQDDYWKNILPLVVCTDDELFVVAVLNKIGSSANIIDLDMKLLSSCKIASLQHDQGSISCISIVLDDSTDGDSGFIYLGTSNGFVFKYSIIFPSASPPTITKLWDCLCVSNSNVDSIVVPSKLQEHYYKNLTQNTEFLIFYSSNSLYLVDSSDGKVLTYIAMAHSMPIVKLEFLSKFAFDSVILADRYHDESSNMNYNSDCNSSTDRSAKEVGAAVAHHFGVMSIVTTGLDGRSSVWSLQHQPLMGYSISKINETNLNKSGESHLRIGASTLDPLGLFSINLDVLPPLITSNIREIQVNRNLASTHSKISINSLSGNNLTTEAHYHLYFKGLIQRLILLKTPELYSYSSLVLQLSNLIRNCPFAKSFHSKETPIKSDLSETVSKDSDSENEGVTQDIMGIGKNTVKSSNIPSRQRVLLDTMIKKISPEPSNFRFILNAFSNAIGYEVARLNLDRNSPSSNNLQSFESSVIDNQFYSQSSIHKLFIKLNLFRVFRVVYTGFDLLLRGYENIYFAEDIGDYYAALCKQAFEFMKIGNILVSLHILFQIVSTSNLLYQPELQTLIRYQRILRSWLRLNVLSNASSSVVLEFATKLDDYLQEGGLDPSSISSESCCVCESQVIFNSEKPAASECETCGISIKRCCFTYRLLHIDFDESDETFALATSAGSFASKGSSLGYSSEFSAIREGGRCYRSKNLYCHLCDVYSIRAFTEKHENISTFEYRPAYNWVYMYNNLNLCPYCSNPSQILSN